MKKHTRVLGMALASLAMIASGSMRRRAVALASAAFLFAATLAVLGGLWAANSSVPGQVSPTPSPSSGSREPRPPSARTVPGEDNLTAYWTPERMRRAKPAPMPTVP
jgi:hypothetical protein